VGILGTHLIPFLQIFVLIRSDFVCSLFALFVAFVISGWWAFYYHCWIHSLISFTIVDVLRGGYRFCCWCIRTSWSDCAVVCSMLMGIYEFTLITCCHLLISMFIVRWCIVCCSALFLGLQTFGLFVVLFGDFTHSTTIPLFTLMRWNDLEFTVHDIPNGDQTRVLSMEQNFWCITFIFVVSFSFDILLIHWFNSVRNSCSVVVLWWSVQVICLLHSLLEQHLFCAVTGDVDRFVVVLPWSGANGTTGTRWILNMLRYWTFVIIPLPHLGVITFRVIHVWHLSVEHLFPVPILLFYCLLFDGNCCCCCCSAFCLILLRFVWFSGGLGSDEPCIMMFHDSASTNFLWSIHY